MVSSREAGMAGGRSGARSGRAKAGQQAATLDEVYRRHHDRLIGYFVRRTHDRPLAEDLAHDTIMRFVDATGRFDPTRPVWPYLKAVAHNILMDQLRLDTRQEVVDPEEEFCDETKPGADLDDTVVLRSLLERAIRDLPERQRIAVELRCKRGWSAPEAAALLGLNTAAFRQLLWRARRNLRAALDEAGARVGGLILPTLLWVRLRTRNTAERVGEIVQTPATALSGEAIASVLVAASLGVAAVATTTPAAPDDDDGSAAVMASVRQPTITPSPAPLPPRWTRPTHRHPRLPPPHRPLSTLRRTTPPRRQVSRPGRSSRPPTPPPMPTAASTSPKTRSGSLSRAKSMPGPVQVQQSSSATMPMCTATPLWWARSAMWTHECTRRTWGPDVSGF